MTNQFFPEVTGPVPYTGPDSTDPLSFRWYEADRLVAGRRMADHLRFAVAYWPLLQLDGLRRLRRGHAAASVAPRR